MGDDGIRLPLGPVTHAEDETSDQSTEIAVLCPNQPASILRQARRTCVMRLRISIWGTLKAVPSSALVRMTCDVTCQDRLHAWTETHEEDVKVRQREPSENEVERIVGGLDHQDHLPDQRVIGPPDLSNVNQRVDLTKRAPRSAGVKSTVVVPTAAKNEPLSHLHERGHLFSVSPGTVRVTHRRRWAMNSGIVSGQSVSPTADLTNFSTQLACAFALRHEESG